MLAVDGQDVTLIDTGYPGDRTALNASVRAIGRRPEDLRAVLLTHAHIDHVGSAAYLAERYGVPVFTDAIEAGHARHEYREQASPLDVVRNAWRPRVARTPPTCCRTSAPSSRTDRAGPRRPGSPS